MPVFNCKSYVGLEAREQRLSPVRCQRVKWEIHGEKMKTGLFVQEKKEAENGLNCPQILVTHLFNRYLLNTYYVPRAWNTSVNETNNTNKRKVRVLMASSHSNGRGHPVNKI